MAFPTSVRPGGAESYGVVVGIAPATTYPGRLQTELWVSTVNSTATTAWQKAIYPPSTRPFYTLPVILPWSTKLYYFKARHVGVGFTASQLSGVVSAQPILMTGWTKGGGAPTGSETRRRVNTLYRGEGILKPTVTQHDGAAPRIPVKGYQTGTAHGGTVPSTSWTDGAAVTFPVTYDTPPAVTLFPSAGVTYWERRASVWSSSGTFSSTGSQTVELQAINITGSGFTPRARIVQESNSYTLRQNNFSTATLDAVGEASSVTMANAPAYNDQYTATYAWKVTRDPTKTFGGTVTMAVAFDVNSTGAYVERGSNTHVGDLDAPTTGSSGAGSIVVTLAGVGATEKSRLRIKGFAVEGPDTTAHHTMFVDPAHVRHYTSTGTFNYAAMCKTTNDTVTWIAQAVAGAT